MTSSTEEKLINKLELFNCNIWFIHIEYVSKIYKKNFLYGINFFMENNKKNLLFSKELKKIIPLYCYDEIYFSKYFKDKECKTLEFFIAFKSNPDRIRCFNKLFQLEKSIHKKILAKNHK